jgi:hypothetical protein
MKQWGLSFNASGATAIVLDDLKYTYGTNTNQLKSVWDASNLPTTTLGAFSYLTDYLTLPTK